MSVNNVKVACRFRPLNSKELAGGWGEVCSFPDVKSVSIKGRETHTFGFDRVFPPTTTQQEIFDEIAKPTIDDILRGYNGTIFVYGQTSSGKTHTMQGPDIDNPEQRGVIPRTSYTLFECLDNLKKNDKNLDITVTMSSVEIYMEKIRDLLTDGNSKKGLEVKEGAKGIYIEGVREETVNSGPEVLKWIKKATSNRSIAATKMNAESSRSHSLFIISVNQKSIADGSSKTGRLYLVDLAGSEKVEKTGAEGKTLDEAKKINLSLSTLGNVINALTDPKKASHIPYRESKLTRVLQESLGGNSKTTLIINCSPSSFNEFETLSTLRFGARAKSIKNAAKINKQQTVEELQLLLKQAEKENQRLQQTITDLQEENRILKGGGGYVDNQAEAPRSRSRSIHRSGSFDNMQVLQEQMPNVVKLHEKVADLENYVDRLEKEKVSFMDRLEEKELENEILTENLVETNMKLQESFDQIKDLKSYTQQKLQLVERDVQIRNRKFAQLEKIFDEQFDKAVAKVAQDNARMKFENQAYLHMVQIRDEKIQSLQMILRHTEDKLKKMTDDIKLLEALYEGDCAIVFRAIDLGTSETCIVKYHKTQYPSESEKNKFSKEFEIGRQLDNVPFVVKYHRFCKINHGKSNALIMEDVHGYSLHSLLEKIVCFGLKEFLDISIKALEGLSHIHQRGVIHQNINPKHLLYTRQTGDIKYIDFGLSTLLNKKFQVTVNFKAFEHGLEWISPEQTGRMNKDVDYRTDLYSLGIVFYRMLCGRVPFSSPDSSKVLYAHIAKLPDPPCKVNSQIPEVISNIILRLLAKAAEDRYQSIYGIKMDLKRCLDQIQSNDAVENFTLGQHDLKSTFQISQKMYGRDKETSILLNSFEKVSSGKISTQLLLVSGYSGIGKTRLINEVHKPLIRDKGYFISGKIDQFARGSPYSSIVQAFKQLVLILLSESEERIGYWKSKLSSALKQQGQVIVDVIPEVELIIGPQPKVAELAPSENQNRFKAIFAEFIQSFADSSHPLVIFLDDLQWADLPTLHLMESILTDPDTAHLLIIGAYRDNEVNEVHPLSMMLSRLSQKMDIINITLHPLSVQHVNQLISDTLGCSTERSQKLAQLVIDKTLGNPFFVQMFLVNLAQVEAIRFNHIEGKWEWDVLKIVSRNITENVVVMMTQRIRKLDVDTQRTLSLAAAIGNKFELKTLAITCKCSIQEAATALWPAIKEELVLVHGEETGFALINLSVPLEGVECQFLHDQVQRAAYELVDPEMRKQSHLNIGRQLLQSVSPEQLDEKIFDVVFHFKVAASLLEDSTENKQLAMLFLRASQRAKDSSAYFPGYEYASFGVSLLPADSWESDYETTLSLHKQLVECEYLRGNFEAADALYPEILDRCQTTHDKTNIYMVQIQQYEMQQRYVELVDTTRRCLQFYGLFIPDWRDSQHQLEETLQIVNQDIEKSLAGRKVMDMVHNPPMTNPDHISVLRVLMWTWAPTYCLGNKTYLAVVSAIMANYALKHGNCNLSASSFVAHSFSHSLVSTNFQESYDFGKLAVSLLDIYPNEPLRHRCNWMFGIGASTLMMPLTDAIPFIDNGVEAALIYGDIPGAGYIMHHRAAYHYLAGDSLETVEALSQQALTFLKRKNAFIYSYGIGATMPALFHREYPPVDEDDFVETNKHNKINLGAYYVAMVQCHFWGAQRDYPTIFKYIDLALINIEGVMGFFAEKELFFIITMLVYSALCAGFPVKADYLELIKSYHEQYQIFARNCPANYEHKLLLMDAERARYEKQEMVCITLYSEAQMSASTHSFPQYEALANELTGRFWHSKTMPTYASTHFKEAFYLYKNWGSKRKVSDMKKYFANYLKDINTNDNNELQDEVDVQTVLRASEAVSLEMSLEQLLDTMMKILLENSGAQRGAFMLAEGEGSLLLVAEGNMDTMQVSTIRAVPLSATANFPHTILNYVVRTKETVIIDNATKETRFIDNYLFSNQIGSVLCVPLIRNSAFKGIIYLENSMLSDVFNEHRTKIVSMLGTQILIHLENSKFSHLLESEKKYRSLSVELVLAKKKLEEFIDVLCHELRNPLNGIYGNSEFLAELLKSLTVHLASVNHTPGLDQTLEDMNEMLNGIVVSSNHLKDMVDTVLDVSKAEKQDRTLQLVTFNPSDIIKKVIAMFQAKARERTIYLNKVLSHECGLVIGDAYRVTQVLINLVSNAIKFTSEGGITISFNSEQLDGNILLHFIVSDTGIGITPEEQQRLFQPFMQANPTTNAKYGGTGLGLSISKELVELMGGTITIQSTIDVGSSFSFFVPCKPVTMEESKSNKRKVSLEIESHDTVKIAKKCNVLIVDDNAINQHLMKRILERSGYSTTVAGNGSEAVDLVITSAQNNQPFQVILMDLEMPIMNGIEATQKIRAFEKQRNISSSLIVGVSANARDYHSQNALDSGMNSYITKPFQKKDILDQLENFMYE